MPPFRSIVRLCASVTLAALVGAASGASSAAVSVAQAAGMSDSLAPQLGAPVRFTGGRVLHSTTTYAIYWKQVDRSGLGQTFYYEAPRCYGPGCLTSYGTDKNYEDRTGTFLQDVGGSSWYGTLSQYWDRDQNDLPVPIYNESTLGGTWEDNGDYPNLGRGLPAASLQPTDIQSEIGKAIQQNGWQVTPDSVFILYIPEEVQACTGTGTCTNAAGNGSFCGFHQSMTYEGQQVAYAVIPSPGDTTACDITITSPSTDLVVDNAINAEAHELVEAVTDPFGNGWSDPVANLTDVGGEVGDKCETDFPGRGYVLADGGNVTLNGHDYILQSLWSELDGGCKLGRVAVPYLDAQGVKLLQVEDGSPSIQITGHSFGPTATVLWNGTPIPTTVYSSQALGVSIPAGNLSRPGVASIAVTQQNTDGGTSNPQYIYIIPSSATVTNLSVSPDFSGQTSIGTAPNQLMVTVIGGTGALALAQFTGNPVGSQISGTTNSYFDIYASPTGFTGLTVQDCALNGGSQVDWFDPAAGWKAASKQTYNPASQCSTITVDATTSPSLSQLQGTALGALSLSAPTPVPAPAPPVPAPASPVQQPTSGGGASGAAAPTVTFNDTDPSITYSGGGWGYYPGRPAACGDVNNDVHATTNNGDSVSFTFKGTGVSYASERSDGYGAVQVSLDGAVQTVVDANAPGVHNQGGQSLYSVGGLPLGPHTLTLAKTGGVYMLLDNFVVQTTTVPQPAPKVQLANDTDPTMHYSGSGWGYYSSRPTSVFDIQNDVHATTNNGDSVSYTFNGTGVSYISEKSDGYGQVDVYLDGAPENRRRQRAGRPQRGQPGTVQQERPRRRPAHHQTGQDQRRLHAAGCLQCQLLVCTWSGISTDWPMSRRSGSSRGLVASNASRLTPNFAAIVVSQSPGWTT